MSNMKLTVKRFEFGTNYSVSKMYIDDTFLCYVLEDKVRELPGVPVEQWKVAGKTAIPSGTYRVDYTDSTRFGRKMPQLLNVPGFEGVRIHKGNTDADTEGCLLLGTGWAGTDFISGSKTAFEDNFLPLFLDAIKKQDPVTLQIGDASVF